MATEEQANKARKERSSELVKGGAHSVGVEHGKAYGHDGFVVVAHVPPGKKKPRIPDALSIATPKGEVDVPVVISKSEPFEPE